MRKIIFIILATISQNLSAAVVSSGDGKDNIYLEGIGLSLAKKHILISDIGFINDINNTQLESGSKLGRFRAAHAHASRRIDLPPILDTQLENGSDSDYLEGSQDYIFISHEIFLDYFPASNTEIDYQYGLGFNFGYGYKQWDFYTAIGFVRSAFEYDDNTGLKDYERNSVYYGIGVGYNLTDNFAVKLQGKTYDIDLRDNNGDKMNFSNNSLNLVLGIGF